MEILLDSGVVIRSALATDPLHQVVKQALASHLRTGDRLVVAPQSLYEFWVVMTRPQPQNGFGLATVDAAREIRRLLLTFDVLGDPPTIISEWLALCEKHNVTGKPAHDARIAAFGIAYSLDAILTLNPRDFARYNITVLTP